MADRYTVDTDVLRDVAGSLGGQASRSRELPGRDTGLPSGAWGRLGHEFGLPELYTEVRGQAETSLVRIHGFLDWAAQTLSATAGHYDEQEQAVARRFAHLADPGGER